MIAGLTDDELFAEVVVAPRSAYPPLPGLQVITRPGWHQLIAPTFRNGTFNGVWHAVLDPREADAIIDATIASYRAAGLKFRWSVDPQSAPPDLAERLAQRGLEETELCGMVRATQPIPSDGPPSEVTVERVTSETIDDYASVMAAVWGGEPSAFALANTLALADPAQRFPLYLARFRGAPAGAAGSVLFERSAYLIGAVVLPELRRAGAYRALVTARLADAAAAGCVVATSHARASTSAPLLAKLGFIEVARWRTYRG